MQNYKGIMCSNGYLMNIKTDERVTWKLGDDLLWDTVFNIEVLEAERRRIHKVRMRLAPQPQPEV